ncbi:hypothetical protein MNBD_GAMMA21-1793 [hydrothermal vent metagenome]|uniref:Uncharacterized protein n=1 Tax=hydrothermal vent metagenome TaxID=652676 RepID=A0A3B0ZRK4_9ZZZZ
MGLVLSFTGFSDFESIHNMFIFSDLRLLYLFIATLMLSALGFAILTRQIKLNKKPVTSGTVPGSIMFGIGWALTGACPSIALVQIGEGKMAALFTVLGIFFGVWVYRKLSTSTLKLDKGVCGED